ncbi:MULTISPECIES: bifunctional lysylphosphatidylglycerol flippase/synthetase MprF [unclassified Marinobacter]|uniref:bifunctional lysylphosphatidylglycerol flippase/synthetase MprF n=1 Tax=unclassified Marinobacter TaxID=83889 RepID=UPI00200BA7E5|nr:MULTISPECIES: bifunctional lysylphosphatidylglycerol flippase/synthetase MprF [unclassified Marinobacter]UQG58007.1 bifunctional lysylphosphatidylglycerol flippase/synthetase MprF [Marinobacter sp. M4C]UQG66812.1 bifunctional lysylphosphatidylglycerol flippase/synthetase MprF [Marinobacter sp. M2C]UQG71092.1 bifunctional lysylphosphatidylglycerol flippase/synthetase MprF [Marinobacter sp. M1C]
MSNNGLSKSAIAWPVLIGLVLFGLAIWFIHRELAHLDLRIILAQIAATPPGLILLAVAATAGSYFTLIAYDRLALRWIERPFTHRRIVLASFTAYALANNVGFGVLSGGAVRYKLYGGWGLSAAEIAKIIGFVALTTVLGISTILGIAAIGEGQRLAGLVGLPGWFGPLFGVVVLLIPLGWLVLAALKVVKLTWRDHTLAVPSLPIATGQIAVSLIDHAFAALALYVLLPDSVGFGPLGFLGLYIIANTVGLISNVPGGIGVFDAVILLAVPHEANASTVAALVTYRVIYYLLPLGLAGLLFAGHALRHSGRGLMTWSLPLAPSLFAVLVFVSGLLLLVSGATPSIESRVGWLNAIVPLGVIELSHFFGSLVGVALLLVADGLRRRIDAAWLLACGFLAAGILFSLLKGADYEEALGLTVTLVILLPCRRAFDRKTRLLALTPSPSWLVTSAAGVAACLWLGFFAYRHVDYVNDLWWSFMLDEDAPRFLRASVGVVLVLAIVALRLVLRPAPALFTLPEADDLTRAEGVIQHADGLGSSASLALLGDKYLLYSPSGESFIMFGIQGVSWIAMGEPVGRQNERRNLVWSFVEACHRHGGRPAFYQITPDAMPMLAEVGLAFQKLGEQAYVPLGQFDLQGPAKAKLRQTWNRGQRDKLVFTVVAKAEVPAIINDLRTISDQWLGNKNAKEKGFSLGRFNADYIRRFPVALLRLEGRIVAFANLWTTPDCRELSIDLMRYVEDAPHGVMDLLFIELMLWGRQQGYAEFDLGMAPMSGLEARALAPRLSRAGALVFRHAEHFYNFQGLHAYKEKFDPVWRPRYLAARPGIEMALTLGDTALIISGGMRGLISQ